MNAKLTELLDDLCIAPDCSHCHCLECCDCVRSKGDDADCGTCRAEKNAYIADLQRHIEAELCVHETEWDDVGSSITRCRNCGREKE